MRKNIFRLYQDRHKHVALKYKNWSKDEEWFPKAEDAPLEIFHLDEKGHHVLPEGEPALVQPQFERKQLMHEISANIHKIDKFLTTAERKWWEDFLKEPGSIVSGPRTPWYLGALQPCVTSHCNQNIEPRVSPLSLVMDKERKIPKVNLC